MPRSRVDPRHDRVVTFPERLEPNELYPTNFVSTTKYTAVNFLPRNLMVQFQRVANIYFLAIAALASISVGMFENALCV